MKLTAEIAGETYEVAATFHDLSIPLRFNGPQPNTYGVPKAISAPYQGGGFVGDTRQGSGCNFETYTFTPHCNGTHTECIGHIALERISIRETLQESLIPAILVTVTPRSQTKDNYTPELNPTDKVIDREMLEEVLGKEAPEFLKALIIRTLPNGDDKKSQDYMAEPPPFLRMEL